jgi:hypothetical protein
VWKLPRRTMQSKGAAGRFLQKCLPIHKVLGRQMQHERAKGEPDPEDFQPLHKLYHARREQWTNNYWTYCSVDLHKNNVPVVFGRADGCGVPGHHPMSIRLYEGQVQCAFLKNKTHNHQPLKFAIFYKRVAHAWHTIQMF